MKKKKRRNIRGELAAPPPPLTRASSFVSPSFRFACKRVDDFVAVRRACENYDGGE